MNDVKDTNYKYYEDEIRRLNEKIIQLKKVDELSTRIIALLKSQINELRRIRESHLLVISKQDIMLRECKKFLDERCSWNGSIF